MLTFSIQKIICYKLNTFHPTCRANAQTMCRCTSTSTLLKNYVSKLCVLYNVQCTCTYNKLSNIPVFTVFLLEKCSVKLDIFV